MYPEFMIQLISDASIFTLLGIKVQNPSEENEFVDDMSTTIALMAINRLQDNPVSSEEERKEAQNFIESNKTASNFFELLKAKYPQIDKYIQDETYLYKRSMLLDQIEDDLNTLPKDMSQEDKNEYLNILNDFKQIIQTENEEEFAEAWAEYLIVREKII